MSSNGNHFENDDALVVKMQKMMSEKDARISYLEKKLNDANNEISLKDRNIDQLRSVLYQKNDYLDFNGVHNNGKQNCRSKKFGIIGETFDPQKSDPVCPQPKEIHLRERIKDALLKNEFLSNLEISQIDDMIKYMHEITIEMNSYIIKEGDDGDALYVCLDGKFEVWKENRLLGLMENDRAFGELALLYNCNRTASVKAIRKSNLWKLDRKTFQYIMFSSTIKRQEVTLNFLKTIPALRNLSMKKLLKLADVVEQINYKPNDYIIRENEVGEAFFIIVRGSALVSQTNEHGQEKEIRRLTQGDWFGEKALYTLERRSANVRAIDNVELLSLDRGNFIYLIGNLNEIKSKDYSDHENKANSGYSNNNEASSENSVESAQDEEWLRLIEKQDLITIGILGIGGFGRVELVRWAKDENHVFALKCMKKHHIVHTKQQQHIISEREILIGIRSPFICRLYKTYKDSKYVYMLIEPCLGGELWTILRNKGNFDDTITRFVIACVLEAFTFLHTKGILYRDLKPENLLLDSRGYIKMCDFGFAKKVGVGRKTWTFCGTPEYVAPEIILNKGHDHSADYWSLGILMFELLTGSPPFSGVDPMKIYNIILRGIEAIEFPPNQISKNAGNLIRKLCVQSPVERLGYGRGGIVDIKQNRYFQGFDWIGLHRGVSVSPIVPKIKSNTDMSNFDIFHYTRESPPDELSGWDQDY